MRFPKFRLPIVKSHFRNQTHNGQAFVSTYRPTASRATLDSYRRLPNRRSSVLPGISQRRGSCGRTDGARRKTWGAAVDCGRQLLRNRRKNAASCLLTSANRRGAPGGKVKMTLGLPVYVRSYSPSPKIDPRATGPIRIENMLDTEEICR